MRKKNELIKCKRNKVKDNTINMEASDYYDNCHNKSDVNSYSSCICNRNAFHSIVPGFSGVLQERTKINEKHSTDKID